MPYQLIDTVTPDVGAKAGADKINNNAIQAQYQGGYFTVGGTANAITLTSATGAPSGYSTGQEFCFRANATNTGVTTVNVDGLGIKTIKTLSGADLPAGYLSTAVDTCLRYDGVNMVANVSTGALADQVPTNANLSAAVCGTASFSSDVYTFSPVGTGFRPLQAGMYLSFKLPSGSANTTTTPDVDYNGSTYVIKWIDGSALAANDLTESKNKQPILLFFDGASMLIASDIRGDDGNDTWLRMTNGKQFCEGARTTPVTAATTAQHFPVFAKAFSSPPSVTAGIESIVGTQGWYIYQCSRDATTTGVTISTTGSSATGSSTIIYHAVGSWY